MKTNSRSLWRVSILLAPLLLHAQATRPVPKAPLAVVGGEEITEADLVQAAPARMIQIRNQEYRMKAQVIEEAIRQKLLQQEARKQKVEPEALLKREVDSKVADATDEDVESAYEAQKDRLSRPLDELRPQIAKALKTAAVQKARREYLDSLRRNVEISVLLKPPKTPVAIDPARLRGDPDAPVTIVEFSDFRCPYCARSTAVLANLLAKYKGQVRIAYRDYPLTIVHSSALSAAEAARCAGEQGKFWEYHDALFADLDAADAKAFTSKAQQLGLNTGAFASCFESHKYQTRIEADLEDGKNLGIEGTPGFFVNGVFLGGIQPAAEFEKIIKSELAAKSADRDKADREK